MPIYTLAFLLIFFGCGHSNKTNPKEQCGSISLIMKVLDSSKNSFIEDTLVRRIIYYRDSSVIYEVPEIQISNTIYTDAEISDTKRGIYQFTFLDLKYRSFYDYNTFTDSARLNSKYTEPDTGASFVWKFYDNQFIEEVDKSLPLSDTIMDNIAYKRYTVKRIYESPKDTLRVTFYFNCDRKGMFRFIGNFSDKIGCPAIMIDEVRTGISKSFIRREIKYDSDTLTPYQHKVFDAWEKYAKEHPVER